ncbi:hypothetical protein M501DRAFT_924315 [Patellaria atrata CBS 101060]|uniref:Core domain-containing protein n=1 Tax=Patellaria atrata CBS 101060 TaxID=1346257 RepID=A0A9P4VVJ9_9PEZI|nr:hypothetical protein M501DRAFT_924315 [Patellaria atrata CBS 101060]
MASAPNICSTCLRALRRSIATSRSSPRPSPRAIRTLTTLPAAPPLLEFLAPSIRPRPTPYPIRKAIIPPQSRGISSSTSHTAKAVLNPRKDDNGNEMILRIHPRASERISKIRTKDSNPSLALRITVEPGGCHGFQYSISLDDLSERSPEEDDTVFESDDGRGANVVIDQSSLEVIKGSKIDFVMELIGSEFKVTEIPGAKSSCGCGTSFEIND